jgi:endonuclease/exonuclease/phosphatase family metal-dependent hydrolase
VDVIAEIRPDLIALQEAQHYVRRGTGLLDLEALGRECGLRALPVEQRPDHQGWRGNVVLVRRDAAVLRPPAGCWWSSTWAGGRSASSPPT